MGKNVEGRCSLKILRMNQFFNAQIWVADYFCEATLQSKVGGQESCPDPHGDMGQMFFHKWCFHHREVGNGLLTRGAEGCGGASSSRCGGSCWTITGSLHILEAGSNVPAVCQRKISRFEMPQASAHIYHLCFTRPG